MPLSNRAAQLTPSSAARSRVVSGAQVCAALALIAILGSAAGVAGEQPADGVQVQGRWAFTERPDGDGTAYMATTSAVEDADTWLLLACAPGHRFAARLMHAGAFPFTLDERRPVELRSATFGTVAISVTPMSASQFAFDPRLLAQVLPLLLEEESIRLSMPGGDARPHQYSFTTRPNDIALAHIRSGCLAASDDN